MPDATLKGARDMLVELHRQVENVGPATESGRLFAEAYNFLAAVLQGYLFGHENE